MEPFVDVAFPLKGESLPLDHGYQLFSAVSRALPLAHQEEGLGLFPVHGKRTAPGVLSLISSSCLTLRLPATRIVDVLTLAGQTLVVGKHSALVGIPRVFPLQPRPVLSSRFVTVKKFQNDPSEFAMAVRRQLFELGVAETCSIVVGARRVLKVADHTIVGFSVGLESLTPDESIRVQTDGIGGRRHMGAGLFLPLSARR